MLTVFWDMKEFITIDFLEKGAAVDSASNSQFLTQYSPNLLDDPRICLPYKWGLEDADSLLCQGMLLSHRKKLQLYSFKYSCQILIIIWFQVIFYI